MAKEYQFMECPDEYGSLSHTFSLDLRILREDCQADNSHSLQPTLVLADKRKIAIPLTVHGNILARVDDFNREHNYDGSLRRNRDRLRFYYRGLNSCTYTAFSKDGNWFKIVPECLLLIEQPHLFDADSLPVDHDSLIYNRFRWEEGKYCRPFSKDKVVKDPIWREFVQGDQALLKEYADIVFGENKKDEMMGLYIYHPDPKAYYRNIARQLSVRLGSLAESCHAYSTQYSNQPFSGVFLKVKKR